MFKRMMNGLMLVAVAMATVAGYTGLEPARASVPGARVVETPAPIERTARAGDSCEERSARRRPIEPEGCIDPTALAAR
jgi:hypothetical protein